MSDLPRDKPTFRDGTEGAVASRALPAVTLGTGFVVRESHFAGAYYCGHLTFVSQRLAREGASSLLVDDDGDPLAGFIHVPADEQTSTGAAPSSSRPRLDELETLLATLLAGLPPGARRVLITGFGPFRDVADNPTGAFAADATRLQRLASASGKDVRGAVFSVDDRALDGGAASVQAALAAHAPHALIALGVHRGTEFRIETRADSSGLRLDASGSVHHDDTSTIVEAMPENRALWRALVRALDGGSGQS